MSARECQQALICAALELDLAERMVDVSTDTMTKLKKAEDRVALAARDLTAAVAELPPLQRPKGWAPAIDLGKEETA